jgi:hypothetical protein
MSSSIDLQWVSYKCPIVDRSSQDNGEMSISEDYFWRLAQLQYSLLFPKSVPVQIIISFGLYSHFTYKMLRSRYFRKFAPNYFNVSSSKCYVRINDSTLCLEGVSQFFCFVFTLEQIDPRVSDPVLPHRARTQRLSNGRENSAVKCWRRRVIWNKNCHNPCLPVLCLVLKLLRNNLDLN